MYHAPGSAKVAQRPQLAPEEELRVFRNLMRSLSRDAVRALTELEMGCEDAGQLEQCLVVQHYLDYMKWLCEGRA